MKNDNLHCDVYEKESRHKERIPFKSLDPDNLVSYNKKK